MLAVGCCKPFNKAQPRPSLFTFQGKAGRSPAPVTLLLTLFLSGVCVLSSVRPSMVRSWLCPCCPCRARGSAQHHPSCAVYQQTPGGKALVHRARMPSVSPRKKGQKVSVFAASLPRSVVVEGTFQVRGRSWLTYGPTTWKLNVLLTRFYCGRKLYSPSHVATRRCNNTGCRFRCYRAVWHGEERAGRVVQHNLLGGRW